MSDPEETPEVLTEPQPTRETVTPEHADKPSLTYDRKRIDIALSCDVDAAGVMDARYVVRVTPAHLDTMTGIMVLQEGAGWVLLRGQLSEIQDPSETVAVQSVREALSSFLAARGL
jgi:hypothetical protein